MAAGGIGEALDRVESVLRRRPSAGLREDATGTARWTGGARVVASHANGTQVSTDMPSELGGTGDQVSAGWLVRAGVASCAATTIAMNAVRRNIDLESLEVSVTSRSDTRGFLGMTDDAGAEVFSGLQGLRMTVRISARGVPAESLRSLVDDSQRLAPMSATIRDAIDMDVRVEVGTN